MAENKPHSSPPIRKLTSREKVSLRGPATYSEVVHEARLRDILLVQSQFFVVPEFHAEKDAKLSFKWDIGEPSFDPKAGVVSSMFQWVLEARSPAAGEDDHTERPPLLTLSCHYFIVYDNLEDCDGEAAKAFVRRVGTFATYPYFRAFASQLAWASGTNFPPLPILTDHDLTRAHSPQPKRTHKTAAVSEGRPRR